MILAFRRCRLIVFVFLNLYVREVIRSIVSIGRTLGVGVVLLNRFIIRFTTRNVIIVDSLSLGLVWLSGLRVIVSLIKGAEVRKELWWSTVFIITTRFIVNRFLGFYILFELRLIPILLMILYHGSQPERIIASLSFFLYTLFLSLPYMVVIMLILTNQTLRLGSRENYSNTVLLLLIIPFLVKMPVLGLHFWLPKAHVEANTAGSIVLAGLLLKLGSYGVRRVYLLFPSLMLARWRGLIWLVLSLLRALITIIQRDVKKLVAYRSVTHMTFVIIGITVSSKLLVIRALLLSLAHGWASIGIFLGGGSIRHRRNSRLNYFLSTENAFYWYILLLGALLIRNARVPPMPSFFPEVGVVISMVRAYPIYWFFMFVFCSLAVCYYNTFLFLLSSVTVKSTFIRTQLTTAKEGNRILMLLLLSFLTLGWLQLTFKWKAQTVTLVIILQVGVLMNKEFGIPRWYLSITLLDSLFLCWPKLGCDFL